MILIFLVLVLFVFFKWLFFCLFRDASHTVRAGRHFLVQDVSLPVYELLRVTLLHSSFQPQVSEYREMKIEDDGKITYTEIGQPRIKLAIKLPLNLYDCAGTLTKNADRLFVSFCSYNTIYFF